ncbi:MAG: ABC transporter ATP-binding protein, partial [Clostridiales bacterium]|nr:ABC transporter ATP-binding protein [Clostridiales bacterium]
MDQAIKVSELVKSYASNTVIKGISFEVNKGEIFALLGVNGAGKTTTLDCIEGLKNYDSGSISVNGKMGVQLQSTSLPSNMKPLEVMKLFSKWSKTPFDESLIETFDIKVLADKQYKQLSTGQKRRLHLALSLIGDPDIIFLDEPTSGLDVESRARLHDEIRKLKAIGKTIVMASHDMAEVESLCDRIAILKDGVFAFIGTANELTRKASKQATIFIKTINPFEMKKIDACEYQGKERGYDVFQAQNLGDVLFELLSHAKKTDNVVVDVRVEKSTLEQRFIDIA